MSGKRRRVSVGWWFGIVLFVMTIGGMLFDILQRDGVIGQREEVLVMGTNAGFKPFEYKQGDEVVGFDVDLAREIARDMGKELKIEDMAFDGLLPALSSGQVDMVVAGMSVTPDRAKNALFSDPYYSAAQRLVVKRGSQIRNKYQLAGRKIGVQLGTTGDTLASKIDSARISQFPTAPSVLQELQSGGVEVVILDDAPAAQYVANFPELEILPGSLSDENYAIAIRQGNRELLDQVNRTIAAMKKDGRYDNLIRKHFGTKSSESTSSSEESP